MHNIALATLAALLALPAVASTADAPVEEKRWSEPSFVLEVLDTTGYLPRQDVLEGLEESAATWNAVGTGPEIRVAPAQTGGGTHPVALDGVNRVGVWQQGEWPYPPEAGAVTLTY